MATRALNQFDKERTYDVEELDRLTKRAEADILARREELKFEFEKEKFRYTEEKKITTEKVSKATKREADFWSAISAGLNELQQGENWGNVWNKIHQRFPEIPNETIDSALGTSWREYGAFQEFIGKKGADAGINISSDMIKDALTTGE